MTFVAIDSFWRRNELCLRVSLAFALVFLSFVSIRADPVGTNLLPSGSFDSVTETYNPWAGVDGNGNIHGLDGSQNAVGDDGHLYAATFGPSVAVGDLNGDGIPDLVVADSRGFIWYFPNSGTPQQPKFTQGQVIPVWLGENVEETREGVDNIVPRIQLVDLNNDGKLSLVVGTYSGKLFYIPNGGSAKSPDFPVVTDPSRFLVNTHLRGQLWCNYLSPFLYNWSSSQLKDLVMGEGTYSANSIYLFHNNNSNLSPDFSGAKSLKIIPGMGLEQLTPTVIDWNNDGKPDIICGDRTGDIMLFLNTSVDPQHPTFDTGRKLSIGGTDNFGGFTTVTVGDLYDNKLPNLLIGTNAGTILYATNKGKLGAPDFPDPAVPLMGVNPYPKITVPIEWVKSHPEGVPDELVTVVNPDLEKGFAFPPGESGPYALKFSLLPVVDPTFKNHYYPPAESTPHEHDIACTVQTEPMSKDKRYKIHLWAKADSNVGGLYVRFSTFYRDTGSNYYPQNVPISVGPDWTEINEPVRWNIPTNKSLNWWVDIRFTGQGTLYLDDLSVKEEP